MNKRPKTTSPLIPKDSEKCNCSYINALIFCIIFVIIHMIIKILFLF